jgi:predicted transcriptional regulator
MNRQTIEKMKRAQAEQADEIRALPCYEEVSREFDAEYELALELHRARSDAHLTQAQVAERMGTTQSVISRIEGGSNVSVETLRRYATACGKELEVHIV